MSGAELPIHRADLLVASILPLLSLLAERLNGRNIVSQTLPCQYAQLNLSDVEPTRVLGSVVDLHAVRQSFGLLRLKHFRERGLWLIHHLLGKRWGL